MASSRQDFKGFDRADEKTLNRILWHAARGPDAPFPADWEGAHGRGLQSKGLTLADFGDDDDDDDDEFEMQFDEEDD